MHASPQPLAARLVLLSSILVIACGDDAVAGPDSTPDMDTGDTAPVCGNGVREGSEACDGADLAGASCASRDAAAPVGILACNACEFDDSDCRAPTTNDADADDVTDDFDPAPNDNTRCGDDDGDGCDDCSVEGRQSTSNDGYDPDGDGDCELALDYDCMNGEGAAADPYRLEACVVFTLHNNDRAHFSEESGNAAPLVWNEDIWEVAVAHSRDMCATSRFAHTNAAGLSPSERAAAAGLPYSLAENISVDLDPRAAQYAWMEEPTCTGHRGTILSPRRIEVGIGYHVCNSDDMSYDWRNHHHVTGNYRAGSGISESAFCANATTDCEIPPQPPSTALCPPMLVSWGFCPDSGPESVQGWGCPND